MTTCYPTSKTDKVMLAAAHADREADRRLREAEERGATNTEKEVTMHYYRYHGMEIAGLVFYTSPTLLSGQDTYCSECDRCDEYLGYYETENEFRIAHPDHISLEQFNELNDSVAMEE